MKKTILDINVKNKKVLLRVDFNVPVDEAGNVLDDSRIVASLPTIKYLLKNGAKLIICSHLGRPGGKIVPNLSLINVAKRLLDLLPFTKIKFAFDCIGENTEKMANDLKGGEILLLENLRFHKEERENDPFFAKKLANLADIYVNDAFGTVHRNHASVSAVPRLLPNAVGFLMGKELNTILGFLEEDTHPFVAVLGGAKVSDKIYVVLNLMKKADAILIGGGMAYTFLKAKGVEVGNSLVEEDKLDLARELLQEAENSGKKIILPIDHRCGTAISSNVEAKPVSKQNIPEGLIGLDIGPKTVSLFKKHMRGAKRIIWNGPLGMFEFDQFAKGTEEIAKHIASKKTKTIVGGGDSIAAIRVLKLQDKIYHISTGGGATLKLLEGMLLPGVESIQNVEKDVNTEDKKGKKNKK